MGEPQKERERELTMNSVPSERSRKPSQKEEGRIKQTERARAPGKARAPAHSPALSSEKCDHKKALQPRERGFFFDDDEDHDMA